MLSAADLDAVTEEEAYQAALLLARVKAEVTRVWCAGAAGGGGVPAAALCCRPPSCPCSMQPCWPSGASSRATRATTTRPLHPRMPSTVMRMQTRTRRRPSALPLTAPRDCGTTRTRLLLRRPPLPRACACAACALSQSRAERLNLKSRDTTSCSASSTRGPGNGSATPSRRLSARVSARVCERSVSQGERASRGVRVESMSCFPSSHASMQLLAAAAPHTQLRSRYLPNLRRHTLTALPPRVPPSHSSTRTCFQEACHAAWQAARRGRWQALVLRPARFVRRRRAPRGSVALSPTPLDHGLRQAVLLSQLLLLSQVPRARGCLVPSALPPPPCLPPHPTSTASSAQKATRVCQCQCQCQQHCQ